MRAPDPDLGLTARKSLVARMLRSRFDVGAVDQVEYFVLQGRIEQARDLAELDAIQAEVERIGGA